MRTAPILARPRVAILALLALLAPLVSVVAAAGSSTVGRCAMCAKRCCCAPQASRGGCRIERPCGGEESTDPVTQVTLGKPAIRAEVSELLPPNNPGASIWCPSPRLLESTPLPPERPPRPGL